MKRFIACAHGLGPTFGLLLPVWVAETDSAYAFEDGLMCPNRKHRVQSRIPKLGALMTAIDGLDGLEITRMAMQLLAMLAQRPGKIRQAKW
ncbi:hypothetical protein [Shimia sagamensis]|uniref:Uncharacterized protein n=1 Tax=Shimia sagamensis TaxID=1566352 RepID=A0ABY1PKX2_9RHOB|nr:hypothetical protein [Shimia sagamensis]SMP35437.1 hypothetical protein SAMN06265373_11196 [Shimia sagamensis]